MQETPRLCQVIAAFKSGAFQKSNGQQGLKPGVLCLTSYQIYSKYVKLANNTNFPNWSALCVQGKRLSLPGNGGNRRDDKLHQMWAAQAQSQGLNKTLYELFALLLL